MQERQTAESLISESRALLKRAEKYRDELEKLPQDDTTRQQKELEILDLLDQSQRISQLAKNVVSSDPKSFKSYFSSKS